MHIQVVNTLLPLVDIGRPICCWSSIPALPVGLHLSHPVQPIW